MEEGEDVEIMMVHTHTVSTSIYIGTCICCIFLYLQVEYLHLDHRPPHKRTSQIQAMSYSKWRIRHVLPRSETTTGVIRLLDT